MDERHWWIAGKLQESFHIDGYDKPTLLEDFLYEIPTIEKLVYSTKASVSMGIRGILIINRLYNIVLIVYIIYHIYFKHI